MNEKNAISHEKLLAAQKAASPYNMEIGEYPVRSDAANPLRALAYIDRARHEMVLNYHDPIRNAIEQRLAEIEVEFHEFIVGQMDTPHVGYVPPRLSDK